MHYLVHLSAAGWYSAADKEHARQKERDTSTPSDRQKVRLDKSCLQHGTFHNQS